MLIFSSSSASSWTLKHHQQHSLNPDHHIFVDISMREPVTKFISYSILAFDVRLAQGL